MLAEVAAKVQPFALQLGLPVAIPQVIRIRDDVIEAGRIVIRHRHSTVPHLHKQKCPLAIQGRKGRLSRYHLASPPPVGGGALMGALTGASRACLLCRFSGPTQERPSAVVCCAGLQPMTRTLWQRRAAYSSPSPSFGACMPASIARAGKGRQRGTPRREGEQPPAGQ